MRITHRVNGFSIGKDGCATSTCILSNSAGGFLLLSDQELTKYNGMFIGEDLDLFKVLENIGIVESSAVEIENCLGHINRRHEGNSERIVFPKGVNGLLYYLDRKAKVYVDFDCRKVGDLRSWGRSYDVSVEKDRLLVRFTKVTDRREDSSDGVPEYSLFVVIKANGFTHLKDYNPVNIWHEVHYPYDLARKDSPASRYVYRPFIINAKSLAIAVGKTKEEAYIELERLKGAKESKPSFIAVEKKDPSAALAFICAQNSLEQLTLRHGGIGRVYAGFPWFHQIWSRDECVSVGSLIATRQFNRAKDILLHYLEGISSDGRLPNRVPSSGLCSADSVGWYWKRVGDLIGALKTKYILEQYLTFKQLTAIKLALEASIANIENNYMKDGLVTNRSLETWMDTDVAGGDGRAGTCIEIQALHLNMLRLLKNLCVDDFEKERIGKKEDAMRRFVVERFFRGGLLMDRPDNLTIRPNLFIAYYVYTDLLSRKEWQACFEKVLPNIWLEWGGLSTIEIGSEKFSPFYTGTDNRSYHHGDSWFWINNLAAICLQRNNGILFEDKIMKIIKASSEEILWSGAVGHHAELSSADRLSSYGCFSQAWSAGMFIELILEVFAR
jgi:hypothetical protein